MCNCHIIYTSCSERAAPYILLHARVYPPFTYDMPTREASFCTYHGCIDLPPCVLATTSVDWHTMLVSVQICLEIKVLRD